MWVTTQSMVTSCTSGNSRRDAETQRVTAFLSAPAALRENDIEEENVDIHPGGGRVILGYLLHRF
jgi:hypothetical protein